MEKENGVGRSRGCAFYLALFVSSILLGIGWVVLDDHLTLRRLDQHPWRGDYAVVNLSTGTCLWTPSPEPSYAFIPRDDTASTRCEEGTRCFDACAAALRFPHRLARVPRTKWKFAVSASFVLEGGRLLVWREDAIHTSRAVHHLDVGNRGNASVVVLEEGRAHRAIGAAERRCVIQVGESPRWARNPPGCPERLLVASAGTRVPILGDAGRLGLVTLGASSASDLEVVLDRVFDRDTHVCISKDGDAFVSTRTRVGPRMLRCNTSSGSCEALRSIGGRACTADGTFFESYENGSDDHRESLCSTSAADGTTRCAELPNRATFYDSSRNTTIDNHVFDWWPVHLGRVIIVLDGVPRALALRPIRPAP